jgi:hypothetical protein
LKKVGVTNAYVQLQAHCHHRGESHPNSSCQLRRFASHSELATRGGAFHSIEVSLRKLLCYEFAQAGKLEELI